jgi:hypothetical protein
MMRLIDAQDGDIILSRLWTGHRARGSLPLVAKPYPIPAVNRPTPYDLRIHPHLALMLLDRRAQDLRILRECTLG